MDDLKEVLQQINMQYEVLAAPEMERFFKELQKKQEAKEGKSGLIYATITNELGAFYKGRSRYAESEACFAEAAGILRELHGGKSPDYAVALNNLAEIYRMEGQSEKAEMLLHQAMEIFRATVGEDHILFLGCLNYLGHFYMGQGSYTRAEEVYQKVVNALQAMSAEDPFMATAYHNLAGALHMQGKNAEARRLLLLSKQLYEEKVGTDDYHYNAVLNSMGIISQDMGEYETAVGYYLQVLEVAEERFGREHVEYAAAAGNLAVCLETMGDYEGAADYAGRSFESHLTVNGPEHESTKNAEQYCCYLKSREK